MQFTITITAVVAERVGEHDAGGEHIHRRVDTKLAVDQSTTFFGSKELWRHERKRASTSYCCVHAGYVTHRRQV